MRTPNYHQHRQSEHHHYVFLVSAAEPGTDCKQCALQNLRCGTEGIPSYRQHQLSEHHSRSVMVARGTVVAAAARNNAALVAHNTQTEAAHSAGEAHIAEAAHAAGNVQRTDAVAVLVWVPEALEPDTDCRQIELHS